MIDITSLSKTYGEQTVLDIDQLHIPTGQTFGLVGNNGAGKTTLFSLMLDLIAPTTGTITNNNIVVQKSEDWKIHTAAFLDENFLIGYLTPEEYFVFIGGLRGIKKEVVHTALESYAAFFHGEVLGQKKYIRDLSKGNQKKVGIVGSLLIQYALGYFRRTFCQPRPNHANQAKEFIKR